MFLSVNTVVGAKYGGNDNKYTVVIGVDNDNYTYIHNIVGFIGTIDWGDGCTEIYDSLVIAPRHIYSSDGRYTVTCIGQLSAIKSHDFNDGFPQGEPSRDILHILRIGGDMGITEIESAFHGQCKLTQIAVDAFYNLTGVQSFRGVFSGCSALAEIPAELFDNSRAVKDWSWAFEGCAGLTEIPEGLFDKCIGATDFTGCFSGCKKLMTIPSNLFKNCTLVRSFNSTFSACNITEIPAGLFSWCPETHSFSHTFHGCKNIISIPHTLFDKCRKVKSFQCTFSGCRAVMDETPYSLVTVTDKKGQCKEVKVHLYERSAYPDYFTVPVEYWRCFYNCNYITDWAQINNAGWRE